MTKPANILPRLRAALLRHGSNRINSRSGMAVCQREVEKITGRPLSNTPSQLARELAQFCERNVSHDMPVRPFKVLVGHQAALNARRALCELVR